MVAIGFTFLRMNSSSPEICGVCGVAYPIICVSLIDAQGAEMIRTGTRTVASRVSAASWTTPCTRSA